MTTNSTRYSLVQSDTSVFTTEGSSANVIFSGSGYLTQGELYINGGLVTLANRLIFLAIGTPWILMVAG